MMNISPFEISGHCRRVFAIAYVAVGVFLAGAITTQNILNSATRKHGDFNILCDTFTENLEWRVNL